MSAILSFLPWAGFSCVCGAQFLRRWCLTRKVTPMVNSRAVAMPMPAPTPAAKWLVDGCEGEGEAEGEVEDEVEGKVVGKLVGKLVGKGGVEVREELEVVVVASVDAEELEVVTATLEGGAGRIVEEVMAAREKIRDEVSQQCSRDKS